MRIKFSPQRRDDTIVLSKNGETLTINGELMDFSGMEEGQTLPVEYDDGSIDSAPHSMINRVERVDGELIVSVVLPHGPNPPEHVGFPGDMLDAPDGPITLPTDIHL